MNEPKLSQRLLSLDALRGFDMLFIMGFATLVVNVCHLFPGDVSAAVAESMSHPAWHGFSHHDTIFPLFLFIAGISYPFSLAKQRSLGATQGDLYRKILKRGARWNPPAVSPLNIKAMSDSRSKALPSARICSGMPCTERNSFTPSIR